MNAIEIQSLKKSFGDIHAVRGVWLDVTEGEILSLLGPNGAGKSTVISMLSGLLASDEGEASIMGHSVTRDPKAAKKQPGCRAPGIGHLSRPFGTGESGLLGQDVRPAGSSPQAAGGRSARDHWFGRSPEGSRGQVLGAG